MLALCSLFLLFCSVCILVVFFFFNDTATTEIYTLSLHDALPIYSSARLARPRCCHPRTDGRRLPLERDRKSTRLNSSHRTISYAVFCLKKKKEYFCCIRFLLNVHSISSGIVA